MVDLYLHSPIRLHGFVLNRLSTGQVYCLSCFCCTQSRDSAVGISARWMARVRFPVVQDFFLRSIQTGGSFLEGKTAGA
jgi:hypothetical protein